MGKKLFMVIRLSAALVLVAVTCIVPLAAADTPYSPQPGAAFNFPNGTHAQKHKLVADINNAIDGTPAGGTIRIATYAINDQTSVDALIRAHRRGVIVKFLVNNNSNRAQSDQLKQVLGNDRSKPSYFHVCDHGCRTGSDGSLHAKLYMFSKSGNADLVTIVGSMNLTEYQNSTGWNNNYTIVGDRTIYGKLKQVFDSEMQADSPTPVSSPYVKVTSGSITAYQYPQFGDVSHDTVLEDLAQVTCSGATGDSGYKGKTVVKVAVFSWDDARGLAIANKLWSLKNHGCYVSVVMGNAAPKFRNLLLQPTKYGTMAVYDSGRDPNRQPYAHRNHSKYLIISGNFNNVTHAHYVLTGSMNYTYGSLRHADEVDAGIYGSHNYDAYNANFNDMAKSSWHIEHPVPAGTVGLDSAPIDESEDD